MSFIQSTTFFKKFRIRTINTDKNNTLIKLNQIFVKRTIKYVFVGLIFSTNENFLNFDFSKLEF